MQIIVTSPDDATPSQLLMLAEIVKLVSRLPRVDIANPPPATGNGNGALTRVTACSPSSEAMIAIHRQLGGPELPSNVETFAIDCRRMGTPLADVIAESISALGQLQALAENFPRKTNRLGMATVSGQAG